jgi:hypothetical protein
MNAKGWRLAATRAALTARWATTITRWAIRFSTTGKRSNTQAVKRWQFVSFAGPGGSESRGIVDLVAIRKDHRTVEAFRPGDLFELVFIQIKGGSAPWPTVEDLRRLRAVQRFYRAKAVVLASWQRGTEPSFYVLASVSTVRTRAWRAVPAAEIFGLQRQIRRAPSN